MMRERDSTLDKALIVLVALLIIYIGYQLSPLLSGIVDFVALVLYPFFLALILYYILRPGVRMLQKKMNIYAAIVVAYCVLGAFLAVIIAYIAPNIATHLEMISEIQGANLSQIFEEKIKTSLNYSDPAISQIKAFVGTYLVKLNTIIVDNIISFVQIVVEFLMALLAVPFILFYMLKDDKKIKGKFFERIPEKHVSKAKELMEEIDDILVHFITGRLIVSIITSTLLLGCFLAIGLDYAFYLFLSSLIFYTIPTLGAFIAAIPPLLVGFSTGTFTGVEVVFIMGGASFIEGFIVTPKIMGKSLYIHPLTMVLVLMAAGLLFGIVGLVIASPVYAILKVIFYHFTAIVKHKPLKKREGKT